MAQETYKNSLISGGAYDGETEIGGQWATPGSTHPDGTAVVETPENGLISRTPVCGLCGFPVEDKAEKMAMTRQRGVKVCPYCRDLPGPRRT